MQPALPRALSAGLSFGLLLPVLLLWWMPGGLKGAVLLVLVLVPLAMGLRFGLVAGSLVATLTGLAIFAAGTLELDKKAEFPNLHFLVILATGMISGEVRDRWAQKHVQLQALSQYYDTRLKQFAHAYHVLQISHTQLERRVVDSVGNLRQALQRLQQKSLGLESTGSLAESGLGPWLLQVFADLGNLHKAALYAVNTRGLVQYPAIAAMGEATELSAFDPLLREALASANITTVLATRELAHGDVIAVIPLADSHGRVHAVIAVFDMLFVSIHAHTFEVLGVLGHHIGDIIAGRPKGISDAQGWQAFSEAVQDQFRQADSAVFPVSLVACTVTATERREALAAHLCRGVRGLDQCWVMLDLQGQPVILKTMPLTDAAGIINYRARLEREWPGSSFGFVCHEWLLHEQYSAEEVLVSVRQVCALGQLDPDDSGLRSPLEGSAA